MIANEASLFASALRTFVRLVDVSVLPNSLRADLVFANSSSNPLGYVSRIGVDKSSITRRARFGVFAKVDVSVWAVCKSRANKDGSERIDKEWICESSCVTQSLGSEDSRILRKRGSGKTEDVSTK